MIIVEQNLKFAKKLADCFIIMQKGMIVASGNVGELTDEITHRYLTV